MNGTALLAERYQATLLAYLAGEDAETALMEAYECGRQALTERVSLLELTRIHHDAILQAALGPLPPEQATQMLYSAKIVLDQAFMPYELAHRGYFAANAALRELNESLERRVTERTFELAASERRFRSLIDNSSDAIALFGPRGDILYGSPATTRILGYEIGEFVGRNAFELIHPDDHEPLLDRFTEVLRRPYGRVEVQARVLHRDGSWRFLEGVFTNLLDDPSVGAIVNNYRDSTERKQAEEERARLLASEQTARSEAQALCRTALALGGELDLATRLERVLDAALGLVQADGSAVLLAEPPDHALEFAAVRGLGSYVLGDRIPAGGGLSGVVLESNRPLRVSDARTDERDWEPRRTDRSAIRSWLGVPLADAGAAFGVVVVFRLRLHPFTDDDERRLQVLAALAAGAVREARLYQQAQDEIAERQRAEAALRDSRARLDDILGSLDDVVWSFSLAEGRMLYQSPATETVYGRSASEFFANPRLWLDVIHPDDREGIERNEAEILSLGSAEWEFRIVRPDGEVRWLANSLRIARDEQGTPIRFDGIARDITERRRAEDALHAAERQAQQTEKLRALGQMASGIAHDLNQSLALVSGYSDLARKQLLLAAPDLRGASEMLEIIGRAADDGGKTVRRLLAFARTRPDGEPESILLSALLREVAQFTAPRWRDAAQADGRPISLHVESDGETTITGWPASLREALTNLVFNAVDALPDGGTIRLSARRRDERAIVEIADSGVGMPPDVQARIFDPFFTTKGEKGTGLGLATVFGIVERHGGQIEVQSTPGLGTTFTLSFPIATSTETGAGPDDSLPPADPGALRILAVDDEPALARMAALILRQQGHTVTVTNSGEEALQRLEHEPFDLVLSDVGMGEGMNGWELAAEIKRLWPEVRFILATGWGVTIDAEQARAKGVEAVIAKPYRGADLVRIVSSRTS